MESQKRMMLALGLAFALFTVYTLFFAPKPPPEDTTVAPATASTGEAPKTPAGQPGATPEAPAAAAAATPAAADLPPVKSVERLRDALQLVFTSEGAALTRAELQGKKMREQPKISLGEGLGRLVGREIQDGPQMDMARPVAGDPLPLSVAVVTPKASVATNARYAVDEATPPGQPLKFTTAQNGLEVTKTFDWGASGFDLAMTVAVKNTGADPIDGELQIHYGRSVEAGSEEKASFFGGVGNESHSACMVADDLHKLSPDGKPPPEYSGPVNFFGVDQQYFLAGIYPFEGPRTGRCVMEATPTARKVTAHFPVKLLPGQVATQKFGIFIGPKDVELLRGVPERVTALGFVQPGPNADASWSSKLNATAYPHLDKTVDFGIWAALCKLLLSILKFFHSIAGNWGIAIVLLTVLVKLALLPLTHKAMVSAESMKKLQPKMEEIKKKHPDDRERQNLETMKLYQEAKVNPLGGCLPMLLQMPVWIALFTTLRNSYELYREPFISPLWMDLTFKDPTYLFPIALGVTMVITQKLQPAMMDAAQAKMMTYVMPVFFTVIMLSYPAGLTLYIFTNNVLSIAQQYGLRKYLERTGVAAPKPPGGPPKKESKKGAAAANGKARSAP